MRCRTNSRVHCYGYSISTDETRRKEKSVRRSRMKERTKMIGAENSSYIERKR